MRIPFKIDAYDFDLATSYDEMTAKEYFLLRKAEDGNVPSMLEALSGVPAIVWDNVSADSVDSLFTKDKDGWFPLKYLYEKIDWNKMPVPSHVTIDGKKIKVGSFSPTLKQKYLMQQCVDKHAKASDPIDSYVNVLAIYFQPIVTGERFSIEAVNEFQSKIEAMSINEAMPLATFFLAKLLGLQNVMQKSWLTKALAKRQAQESESSKPLESSTQLIPLQGGTRSNTMQSGNFLTRLFSRSYGKAKSNRNLKKGITK